MAYATQDDLLQRLSLEQLTQLTDDAKAGKPDAGIVQNALDEASGIVEAYVRDRYQTPLQPSEIATRITRDIAVYELYSRRPQPVSETVRQRYDDAIGQLKDISKGNASLDQPVTAATPQTTTTGPVLPTQKHERFSDRDLWGFV